MAQELAPPPDIPPSGKYEHEKLFLRAIVIENSAASAVLITVDGNTPGSVPPLSAAYANRAGKVRRKELG